MNKWRNFKLGELAEFRKGVNYTSSDYGDRDSGRPFITIKCFVKGGGYERAGLKYIKGQFKKEDQLCEGDVIFSVTDLTRAGDIVGSPLQIPSFGEGLYAVASMDCMRIEPDESICDKHFLYQRMMLPDIRRQMVAFSAGSTVLHLDTRQVPRISGLFPADIRVQKRISRILRSIDETIEKTEVLIEKYRQIKAGLMNDLFTRGIDADGKLRPPREEAPELYQETPIGWIPKDWEEIPLRGMSQDGVAHIKTGPFGSSLKSEHWREDGVPVITIGALGEGEFISEELLYISDSYAKALREYQMRSGEVVFSRVADVGRSVVIEAEQDGWVMSSNLMRIHIDKQKANPHFLQYMLSFDSRVRKQIRCKVNSSGRDVANGQVLNSILFPWAPIEEQEEIVRRAFSLDKKLCAERRLMQVLLDKKSGLMEDLLTGKTQVALDIESEAAHV